MSSDRNDARRRAAAVTALLAEWKGPFGGVPPFDRVDVAAFAAAFEAAGGDHLREIERIAADPAPPDFENTMVALERAGRALQRFQTVYDVWGSSMSTPEFQALERDLAPRLAEHWDRVTQNGPLFRRIETVYHSPERAALDPEQQRLAWLYYTDFVHAGAQLDESAKQRLSALNQRLAALFTRFNQNLLAEEDGGGLLLERAEQLAGLPPSVRDAAAAAAAASGHPGWLIANTRSAVEPFLRFAEDRELRARAWRMWVNRCDNGDAHDNNEVVREILALRAERARLLGYATHAHWRLENTMAATPERALELLRAVWRPALARVREELADMQHLAATAGRDIRIQAWDYRYYAEQVRRARYDLDLAEVEPYLQLERLPQAMFWVAGELFGFAFRPAAHVPVYHPDVRVWEVTDRTSGHHVGLFYFDPFARAGKRSGAWMSALRVQERCGGTQAPIVANSCNFVRGRAGEPALISWDDATTLFHEFGHACHALASAVRYPSLSGTAVPQDYVEFPSQLLEHWLSTPEVLQRFALHCRTGEPIPETLVARIERAATFNQGFATTEYLASAWVDMCLHLETGAVDPATFEREALTQLGMPPEVVMRHRTPHFMHAFGTDSYSAGYYSYLWSDVLVADAWEAFMEGAGPYDPEVAERLRQHVFAAGNTLDPRDAYRRFRGRDAGIDALLRKRGFLQAPLP